MQLETVKVVSPTSDDNPLGYIVINKMDLAADHQRFDEDGVKKEPAEKALSVEQLKAALAENGTAIPDGAKKADLRALLDKANEG